MRKRKNKRSHKSKQLLLGSFIVILMIGSVFGIIFGGFSSSGSNTVKYNDITFKYANGFYIAEVNNIDTGFFFLPQEVEHINVSQEVINNVKGKYQIALTSNLESVASQSIGAAQFYFKQTYEEHNENSFVLIGFLNETQYGNAVISCENATNTVPVIKYEYADENSITNEGNCIIIKGSSSDSYYLLTSRLLYGIFGIM